MAEETIINIDAGIEGDDDINADWIKRVNGGRSQIQELAIHKRLQKKFAAERAKGGGGKQSSLLAALTGEAAPDTEGDAPEIDEDAAPDEDAAEAAPLEDDEDAAPEDAAPAAKPKGDAPFTKPAPKDAKPAKPEDEDETDV